MKNWCSFFGEHRLDFGIIDNPTSYAIFGQIGKGKSSTVAALEWSLFGQVMDTIDDGDDQILRRSRPLIDSEFYNGKRSSFALPLLSDTSFRQGEYHAEVVVEFNHQGQNYVLSKSAYRDASLDGPPTSDRDMKIMMSLDIGGTIIKNEVNAVDYRSESIVQPHLDEIIPQDVSRFFFIKGDAIREFTGLIFGSDNNPKLMNDVNSVVGLPALTRSLVDIRRMKAQEQDRANSIVSRNKGKSDLEKEIIGENTKLDSIRKGSRTPDEGQLPGIDGLREIKLDLEDSISNLESKLKQLDEVKNLLSKREAYTEQLDSRSRNMPAKRKLMRESINRSWKILIQPTIKRNLLKLEIDANKEIEIVDKISEIERFLPHDKERISHSDGSVPCPVCDKKRDALTTKKKSELVEKISATEDKLFDLNYDLESVKGSQQKKNMLMTFISDLSPGSISALEDSVTRELDDIKELEGYISACNDALTEAGDIDEFNQIKDQLTELRNQHVLISNDLKWHESQELAILERLQLLRGRLQRRGGVQGDDLKKSQEKIQALDWFETIWNESLDRYRENIRSSIDEVCTKMFLKWVDSPEKYSKIKTSQNWGLNVYGADNNWAPLANPGHRQLLSICFIEALRHCSEIEFPMIFDNPGAAVDKETIDSILEYYFLNPPSQFLALSHTGAMREDEIISKFYDTGKLSRAWRINFESGSNRHSKFEKVR